ncbi:hypothetical protein [Kingella negevensis]|uniref:hypothetical protein n=1 Tax=Kingella negevensis TaxID=1522312 RepID=UPI00254C5D5A|nr:hypothetical protein [Kingella negevensis]MDK4679315.1 hypothetical protein [Kingella negevensis]MDK4682964.1 hypothetical protein [Kingella negevensis]MDK4691164.1 hypothetical protein [Kingella negevensis]MDK4693688.1 hypothetical protein [Kingella negevensis]MDK4700504.1 hypothetical protein [Kingella negevensis]
MPPTYATADEIGALYAPKYNESAAKFSYSQNSSQTILIHHKNRILNHVSGSLKTLQIIYI